MHPFDAAAVAALTLTPRLCTQPVPVNDCLGRILAIEAVARVDSPPFDRAMMDGFAFAVDGQAPVDSTYPVAGCVAAGDQPPGALPTGAAMRIMTGAPMPPGANAVARFEWCAGTNASVELLRAVRAGESVQPRGQDGRVGVVVLHPGARLTGAHLALCRTFGIAELEVAQRPTCSIIVTGSELCRDASTPLEPGQIYGANDAYVQGALVHDGAIVRACHYVPDDLAAIRDAIAAAAAGSDIVVLTGGVSAGDFDFVPRAVADLEGEITVRRVMMRPGSPFVAARIGACAVFALSGNPAAGFVQFETLVRPAIRAAMGWADTAFPASGQLEYAIVQKPVRHTRILRATARIEQGRVLVDARMAQASGQVSSFAVANCLIRLDEPQAAAGSVVPLRFLDAALDVVAGSC